jgi:GMP synthase-like glutamine amidotransferase
VVRVLVMANRSDADLGLVGDRLDAHGAVTELLVREDHASWPELGRYDAIVSLGSEWSVYWDHVAEPVRAEIAFLRAAHARAVPTFGICFGSQLLAVALGGEVHRAPSAEIGWYDVTPTSGGSGVLTGPWFQWHYDRWTPPPGAAVLAASARANQAFRIGRTLAVQFHPEVTVEMVTRWVVDEGGGAVLDAMGVDQAGFLADCAARMAEVVGRTDALVDWFVADVAGAAVVDPRPSGEGIATQAASSAPARGGHS